MLNALIRFSLRHRPVVLAVSLVVLVYGSYLAMHMPIDVFPELDRPRVTVMTECPGLAAEEVEALVTYPLESALLGATGVRDVRSQSGAGLSAVLVEFDWGTEVRVARQVVQERLATVADSLPPDVRPQMAPPGALMGQIILAGLRLQHGPHGGDLAPIPGTEFYAERTHGADGRPALTAWRLTDRRNPTAWEPVPAADVVWSTPDAEGAQRARVVVGGQAREVVFPSLLQRQLALRTLADWVVRPRLLKVNGVAQVLTIGGGRKQYQVLVDPTALTEYGVTLTDVEAALRANNRNMSGGFAVRGGVEVPIRVLGRLGPRSAQVVEDLRRVPVKTTAHRTVLMEQVARVVEGPQFKRGDASVNGDAGVVVTVTKQPHTDTRAVTAAVEAALGELGPSLPADMVVEPAIYRLREFIDRGVFNVGEALVIGAVLVLIVLFLFLQNLRTTVISLAAIPLSLAATAIAFHLIGGLTGVAMSINVMTLGGVAVAMGELVDDAVVDVENIFRRLRENAAATVPRSALRVVYDASREVRSAIVFGTAVVILVFLPLFALSGIAGRLFAPLGVAYIVSILASLLVSLTVTPVLSYYLLSRARAIHHERDGMLVRGLKWVAGHLVRFSMRWAALLLLLAWMLVAYSGWRLTTLGADFLPTFDEGTVQVNVTLPAGASIEASNEVSAAVDKALKQLQVSPTNPNGEVLSFARRTGRSEMDEHAEPPNANEYFVTINPDSGKSRAEVLQLLHDVTTAEVVGADIEVEQPLAHMISHLISGSTAQIAIQVYGDDLDTLTAVADRVKAAAATVSGVSSLAVEPIRKVDEVHIRPRPDDLAFYGVSREDVGAFVSTALNGEVVSEVIEGQRRFDLLVRLAEPYRADVANLRDLWLDLPGGRGRVRLGDLADVTPPTGGDAGANQVKRDNARRRIVVRCNALGRDLGSVVAGIRAAVAEQVTLPEGYTVEYGGQFEAQQSATRLLVALSGVTVVGVFFVLTLLFPSPRVVLQILNAIPVAFVGGVLALVITHQTLTVASLVGFISLGGIAVRNGILLMTHYVHLMRHEGEGFTQHMILRGSLERLSPVLMTALTAGIALVPLVVAGHQPGREILYPVATVILGGLVTSTLCEFLLHPGLFWRFSGTAAARVAVANDATDELDNPARPHPERTT